MTFGIHPFFLMAGVGLLFALVLIFFACRARSGLATGLLLLLAIVFVVPTIYLFLALHPALIDGRYRTYQAFYRDIQVGMTREQVIAAMETRYPKNGKRQRPKVMEDNLGAMGFFMNPETSREPNCEGIFLDIQKGRVVSKTYSPD